MQSDKIAIEIISNYLETIDKCAGVGISSIDSLKTLGISYSDSKELIDNLDKSLTSLNKSLEEIINLISRDS